MRSNRFGIVVKTSSRSVHLRGPFVILPCGRLGVRGGVVPGRTLLPVLSDGVRAC